MQNSIRKRQQELREKTLLSSLKSLFMQKYKILKPRTSEFVSIAPLYDATTKLQLSDLVCLISKKHIIGESEKQKQQIIIGKQTIRFSIVGKAV